MHSRNDQVITRSGGLTHTAEEKAGDAVKFSLSHFSKHYTEMDTADEPADSSTNGNRSDESLKQLVFTDHRGQTIWNQFNQKSFLEFEIGVIHAISKYLPTTTDGFDQVMETICRYTYNCYWKREQSPFHRIHCFKATLAKAEHPSLH